MDGLVICLVSDGGSALRRENRRLRQKPGILAEPTLVAPGDRLAAARRLYEARGFRLLRSEPHRSFGRDLVGETWERPLHS